MAIRKGYVNFSLLIIVELEGKRVLFGISYLLFVFALAYLGKKTPPYRGLDSSKISGVATNFGVLVHALPGPNKQRALKKKQSASLLHSFCVFILRTKKCDSRCPFGHIDNRRQILGRFRTHSQTNC